MHFGFGFFRVISFYFDNMLWMTSEKGDLQKEPPNISLETKCRSLHALNSFITLLRIFSQILPFVSRKAIKSTITANAEVQVHCCRKSNAILAHLFLSFLCLLSLRK